MNNPGSDKAIEQGCTCPVLDNGHGKGGVWGYKDAFWITASCPLHGDKTEVRGITESKEARRAVAPDAKLKETDK